MLSKEEARQEIAKLVEQYRNQSGTVEGAEYNETQVRCDYLNRFFSALGWDLDNAQGFAESFREVIQEFAVDVEDRHLQRVDYAFKLGNSENPLFLAEAKKPSVKIKDNASAALQIRGYARGKKYVPISILTNFREFAVYDSKVKIRVNDKAAVGRIRYITYDKYLEEFDFLWYSILLCIFFYVIILVPIQKGFISTD
ncbi:hypothetical protein FACS189427_04040 [Planctomycetales bacterium]|nr:hypothetical protein FACS189427_04040 [Planctomycetales bacterium]